MGHVKIQKDMIYENWDIKTLFMPETFGYKFIDLPIMFIRK